LSNFRTPAWKRYLWITHCRSLGMANDDSGRMNGHTFHMKWWQLVAVLVVGAACVAGLGVSIVEKVVYLRLKIQTNPVRLPTDREPTGEEREQWFRAGVAQLRAMRDADRKANIALMIGLGTPFGSLVIVLLYGFLRKQKNQ
jgi:hypothetical protein